MQTSEKNSLFAELTAVDSSAVCGGGINANVKATFDPKTGKIEIEATNVEVSSLGYGGFGFGFGGLGYGSSFGGLGHSGFGFGNLGYGSFGYD